MLNTMKPTSESNLVTVIVNDVNELGTETIYIETSGNVVYQILI